MNCPFCANPAFEGIQTCTICGFSLAALDRSYGAIPRLTPELCDNAHVFLPAQVPPLRAAMAFFHRRFPQSYFHIVTVDLPPTANLKAYAFWLFNRAGLSSDLNRGAENHDVFLAIDAANQRASLIVGYGLEPFINEGHLDHSLLAGAGSLAQGKYFEGCREIIETTADTLIDIVERFDDTYGIDMREIISDASREFSSRKKGLSDSPY
jgi:uncharacterized membrane protein YgcG